MATAEQLDALAAELGVDRHALARRTEAARDAARQQAQPAQPGAAEPAAREFRLWSEHVHAAALFDGCRTQWRRDGNGSPTGLDYAGVRASPAFRRLPREWRERAFEDLRSIEHGWLRECARLAAAERARRQQAPAGA